jgi:hypothetical protein
MFQSFNLNGSRISEQLLAIPVSSFRDLTCADGGEISIPLNAQDPPTDYNPPLGASKKTWPAVYANLKQIDLCVDRFDYLRLVFDATHFVLYYLSLCMIRFFSPSRLFINSKHVFCMTFIDSTNLRIHLINFHVIEPQQ